MSKHAPDLTEIVKHPDPVADPEQIITAGNVRVTVLTDRLIRLEYAHDRDFEDRPSLAVVNRQFPRVKFRSVTKGSTLTVDTGAVTIHCADVNRPFSRSRLSAENRRGGRRWTFGAPDRQNLGGTVRTLDGWKGRAVSRVVGIDDEIGVKVEWDEQDLGTGLLSRGGWVVIDDSGTVVLDPGTAGRAHRGRPWPTQRFDGERKDLYLFAYGEDHLGALAAASRLFGPQPLPPRFAFGYWYSRYYPYTDTELLAVVDELDHNRVPVDVLVIDMDWHRLGWTGYSWDHDLFHDPTETLTALHERDLRICLNLHPAEGVGSHEDAFVDMCMAMGLDPATTDRVPFDVTDPRYVDAYLRLLHHPEEDRGVDFWWMDWQQGTDSLIPGLDPLAWLNHLHWEDLARRRPARRPLIFSRWGGLGAGRHPIGFSGDTYVSWESLAFQPEFTATAANVLYGYWSHDIGGHLGSEPDPEMYTRWLQFGAHSPVLRTHGTLDPLAERKVWEFRNPHRQVMIAAIRRRYELVPYIYGECRRGLDDGRSLVRPMYHEHPTIGDAYDAQGQYMFGTDMIVAPVVSPVGDDSMARVEVWLPQGEWFDTAHGSLIEVPAENGVRVERRYLLDEVPVFVRAGVVIPTQAGVNRLEDVCYPNLILTAYPGADGRHDIYEDDGTSQGYLSGRSVTIPVTHRSTVKGRRVVIGPAEGSYRGWGRRRDVEMCFPGEAPPRSVELDGRKLPWAADPTPGHWSFDPCSATVRVQLASLDLAVESTLRIARSRTTSDVLDGLPGLLRRLSLVDRTTRTLLAEDNRRIVALLRSVERVSADPSTAIEVAHVVRAATPDLIGILAKHVEFHSRMETLRPKEVPVNSRILRSMERVLQRAREQFPPISPGGLSVP